MWPSSSCSVGIRSAGKLVVGILGQQRIVVLEILLEELQALAAGRGNAGQLADVFDRRGRQGQGSRPLDGIVLDGDARDHESLVAFAFAEVDDLDLVARLDAVAAEHVDHLERRLAGIGIFVVRVDGDRRGVGDELRQHDRFGRTDLLGERPRFDVAERAGRRHGCRGEHAKNGCQRAANQVVELVAVRTFQNSLRMRRNRLPHLFYPAS